MSRRGQLLGEALILGLCAALPLLSLVGHPGHILADADSELPVKLWTNHQFWSHSGLFGGFVGTLGWPTPGPLNNPELMATLWFAPWRTPSGRPSPGTASSSPPSGPTCCPCGGRLGRG